MVDTDLKLLPKETAENGQDESGLQEDEDEQVNTLMHQDDGTTVEQDISPSGMAGKETKNAIVLSVSFLCVFSSYMAIQGLQGSLNDEGGLGVISLSCLYGANIISSIIAPLIVTLFPVKRVIIASFAVHVIYTACNFYPSFSTLIPASILLGAVTGTLWTSQGVYLTTCAFSIAKETGMPVYAALSRINGIFWATFDFCNIIGNLVSSLVLYQGHYNMSNTNSSEVCGVNDCPGAQTVDIIADPELMVVYILLGIFLGCVVTGTVITLIFLSPLSTQGRTGKISPKEFFVPLFKMVAKTDMKYLIPLTMYIAISEEICYAEITKSYVSCPIGIQNVGYVMMAYGVSSAISGFAFSRLAKFITRHVLLSLAGAIHLALLVWLYHWIPSTQNTVLIYVLICIWGLGDGLWKTQYNSFLGKHFADHIKCVFAAAEGIKAIGYTLTFICSSLLCMRLKLSIAISFLSVGMALYYFVEIKLTRSSKRGTQDRELGEIPRESKTSTEVR